MKPLNLLHKNSNYVICLMLAFIMVSWVSNAQITILKPNIGFPQACASQSFNTYNFTFSFYPTQNLGSGNQFIIEMSDASGSFSSATTVQTLTNNTSPISGSFAIPTDTSGENYKIRVRSTNPVQTSPPSNVFSAYYAIHNQPYAINNYNSSVNLCEGESFLIEVDDTGTSSSPVFYPDLNYIWYKNFVEISGETSSSLSVTQSGSYYSIVDYGSCVMDSYSNIVTVNVAPEITPTIQTADGFSTICPGSTKTLISVLQNPNYTYTWFKDNIAITGSNAPTYIASLEGIYHLEIENGGCVFTSNAIFLEVTDVDLYLDVISNMMLVPGESLTVTATTDAQTPTMQWYKDNIAISGATNLNYTIIQPGAYKIVVSQIVPCVIQKEASVIVIFPDTMNIVINPDASYVACSSTATNLSATVFEAISVLETLNILNNSLGYIYQWYYYGSPISGAESTNYNVSGPEENGPYFLEVTIPGFGVIYSNNINVNLGIDAITIGNDQDLCNGQTVTFSSNINAPEHTYQWYKDGIAISGATQTTYATSDSGIYYLEVINGTCQNTSNYISISSSSITVTPTAALIDLIIPGQTRTLSVLTSAATPTYTWFRNSVLISGATNANYNATLDGSYKVVVSQSGACSLQEEVTFQLDYPTGFDIQITADASYTDCSSTSALLTINQFLAQTNGAPINILNNTYSYGYKWFKNGIAVSGATATSLTVNNASDNGIYKLEVTIPDFGIISTNTVIVNLALAPITIENSGSLCPGQSTTLSANVSSASFAYQWFVDGTVISGATSPIYVTNLEGTYHLEVQNGSCNSTSNSLSLVFGQINIFSSNPVADVILPGESKIITVTTDASNPAYEWFHNNVLITGETSATFTAVESGDYKVVASQTVDCTLYAEKNFLLEDPINYNIVIAIDPTYDSCTSNSMPIQLTVFEAITNTGTIDIINNPDITFTAQWFKNSTSVSGETNTSINLSDNTDNGNYYLQLTIAAFGTVNSNTIAANLNTNQPLIITSSGLFCTGSPQLDINSNINNSLYTYSWYHNGVLLTTNNNATLTITEIGSYKLILDTGSCIKESNNLVIEESFITVTPVTALNVTVVPGSTTDLTVTTNALQPNFQWYRNGTILPGANMATYTVDISGSYQVIVTQTIGCIMEADVTFTVSHPTNFQSLISADVFQDCVSLNTTLRLSDFTADAANGLIDLTNNPYNYAFQWFKNGLLMSGETASTISLADYNANGDYYLEIDVPNMGAVQSNTISINLGFLDAVTISSSDILCETNSVATIYSDVTDPQFTYQWFNAEDNSTLGTATEQVVTDAGSYYLEIYFGECLVRSNTIGISVLNGDDITLSHPDAINLIENTTIIVTAEGADNFEWFLNGISVGITNSLVISQAGTYTLVAQIGNCEVTKTIVVTEVENNAVAIPNVVTLNNDGINDTWGLPNKYVAKENVDVIIYGPKGEIVFRQRNYMNNWPAADFEFSNKQPVYYYTILEDNIITEKGAITLIK
ncbi:T9SS type B sorting domain-containing protein [Bizionia myxarmorum]|uniref:Gliding motility-associated C-terminal domain-containing protein n=1 Tax=Bizionia myxarmorum TaxID=291186 RepID=A0A5D0QYN0_9FLAO|nr:gliding motility-associated C-terminal domain-containing protein [Bizionia myxarmorum]TYB74312.1 hypothetical protein ES674_14255 [Bizionia myxarmorum]